MFRRVAGRPVLPRTDRAARRRRMISRCQRRIVSGVTSRRRPWRRAFGITPSSTARSARSAQFRFGRRGCCRCKSASWWRRIKISAVFHVCSRRDSCSHAVSRVIRRNTNRRHMIGDHHRRRAERATPLVRAVDAILGTHRITAALAVAMAVTTVVISYQYAFELLHTSQCVNVRVYDALNSAARSVRCVGVACWIQGLILIVSRWQAVCGLFISTSPSVAPASLATVAGKVADVQTARSRN